MAALEEVARGRVAFLTRLGEGLVPGPDTVYQEGDLVHLVVREEDLADAQAALAGAPAQERV
jgi:trk system potassium uptake protein TrkA